MLFFARASLVAAAGVVAMTSFLFAQPADQNGDDPFLWLEDLNGARALEWVKAENAKTLAVLQNDPHFASLYADALKIGESKDRIPEPAFIDDRVFNFWQDADHVRGIWRSTTLADYAKPSPAWTTVLDLDVLAAAERKNWIWQGADCESPSRTRCLLSLSEGGEDASTFREFALATKGFVSDGFSLPRGKQVAAWRDDDALLVSREWEPGELTASGYPYVVKTLERGAPLSRAVEVLRGRNSDVGVFPSVLRDGRGHRALLIDRAVSFFEDETYLVAHGEARKLGLPLKAHALALACGRLIIKLDEDWTVRGQSYPRGSLVSVELAAATADPLDLEPTLVFAPGPREAFSGIATTRDGLVLTTLENVIGRATLYRPRRDGGWSARRLDLPEDATIEMRSAEKDGSSVFLSVTGFLTPTTLWLADTETGNVAPVKTLPPKFDASRHEVDRYTATSDDGTAVPYFVVHPKDWKLDGSNPTLLTAYGGFQVSLTPRYSAELGKLWLERGGTYVVANIRGGGEFGPAWHEAGLKTHRRRVYEDFTAVARDLIARRITSPRRLGIAGGSNGGLLMGVEFTEHPELWGAVSMQIPLLDMLRYEKIEAGASWVGEYGSVSNPDERAFLASISPYHNVRASAKYPKPLIWTTTRDDRVGPQHARKFAAKLASLGIPYFFYELTEGGHGSGATIQERAFTAALEMTYFTEMLIGRSARPR